MPTPKRPLLRIKKADTEKSVKIEIGSYELLLPCRRFHVSYKIAALGALNPSVEFLIRLVRAVPGITEEACATFFGFSPREISHVIEETSNSGYLERSESRLWLTGAGEALFRPSTGKGDSPMIFSVEERRRSLGFDLLSVSPETPRRLDQFEYLLPEIPISPDIEIGSISKRVPARFSKFFRELHEKNDLDWQERRDLYSVDSVTAGDRFSKAVTVRIFSDSAQPGVNVDVDLSEWRPSHELADRMCVVDATSRFVEGLKVSSSRASSSAAYSLLASSAPEFLADCLKAGALSPSRYLLKAVDRAGDVRSDRMTVPLIGPLYTEENARRFLDVLRFGRKRNGAPKVVSDVFCFSPQIAYWGASTRFHRMWSQAADYLRSGPDSPGARLVCFSSNRLPPYALKCFDTVHIASGSDIPSPIELVLVPSIAAAVIAHCPMGAVSAHVVPLGLASFDPTVVDYVQSLFQSVLPRCHLAEAEFDHCTGALLPRSGDTP